MNYPVTYWRFTGFPTKEEIASFHVFKIRNSWDWFERAAALDEIETLRLKSPEEMKGKLAAKGER